jgi:hypothetical protein
MKQGIQCISDSLLLLVLIISISTHLFIHLTTRKKKKKTEIIQNIYKYIVKIYIKKIRFFLHSKRREYLATVTQGQNISTFFPTLRKKIYACISSQNDPKKTIFDLVLDSRISIP